MQNLGRVAIVSGARTPIGKVDRSYAGVHAVELLGTAFEAAVTKVGLRDADIDQVFTGCTHQISEQSINVGRNAWLYPGFTKQVPALTLDAQCCSGQEAANLGYSVIASGQADLIVAGGVESLSRVRAGSTSEGFPTPYPDALLELWDMPHLSDAVERVAKAYGISREAADEYGVLSHRRAAEAWEAGRFDDEIVRIERDGAPLLTRDEGIRPDSSIERSAILSPAYAEDGIVTAANASQFSDGAAAVVLASEEACERHGLEPLAWITHTGFVGTNPNYMFEGPLEVTQSLLDRAGIGLDQVDLVEIHEAFSVPVLMWLNHYGVSADRVNRDGGAIGMGHPYGMSGARQLMHLAYAMRRDDARIGLQVMCGGGGLGTGTILQRNAGGR